jgi:glycosyl transferase family 25
MQAYVVNLARSPDRRAHIMAQLAKTQVQYEIVDAVDGRDLDLEDTRLFDPAVVGTSTYRPGAAGCALSHLKVYRRVLDDGLEKALVLEDDILLPADLGALADAIAQHMRGAEIVLLNFHSHEPCRITKAGSVPLPSSRLLAHVVDEGQPSSTGGYLITREACARMVMTALPLRAQPDDWGFFHREGAIDRVKCVVPMPVANSVTLRTTIDHYRPGGIQARVREAVASARVPLLYQALALRRRRNFRRRGWTGQVEFVEELPGR